MSIVKFDVAGGDAPASDRKPSPSIWKNCRNSLLNDLGLGRYVHEDFYGVRPETQESGLAMVQGQFTTDADTGVVFSGLLPADKTGGRLDMQTPATDNDAVGVFQQIGPGLVMNSGIKVWFEARVALGDVTADHGLFVGLAEEDILSRDVVLDDAVLVAAESMFGFFVSSGDPDDLMAVWNLDAGTGTVVLQDITQSAVYTAASGDAAASLVNDTYYKLGMYFDGEETLSYFVNGYKVAELILVAATHPDDVEMGPIAAFKAGTTAAVSFNIDWIRYAHQEAS